MNPDKWTPDDAAAHLYEIGLGKYGTAFVSNNISGRSLFSLTDKDLRDSSQKLNTCLRIRD